jgi:hypothetical protein
MSGTTPSGYGSAKLFAKSKNASSSKDASTVPQVPAENLAASPRSQAKRGRRDALLTGTAGAYEAA